MSINQGHDLKPDFKNISILLLITSLYLWRAVFSGGNFEGPFLPSHFDLINTCIKVIVFFILYLLFLISILIFGVGPDIGQGAPDWYYHLAFTISFIISLIISYIVICLLLSLWNKIFNFFGERAKLYERRVIISQISLFLIFGVFLPAIGPYFVVIEVTTRSNISINDAYQDGIKLQELRIRNNFIFPVVYELPDVTVCLHDIEANATVGYSICYKNENGQFIQDMDAYHRNVVTLQPNSETKIYLQEITGLCIKWDERAEYEKRLDEFILLTDVGFNNYGCCFNITEDEIISAERIKIIK